MRSVFSVCDCACVQRVHRAEIIKTGGMRAASAQRQTEQCEKGVGRPCGRQRKRSCAAAATGTEAAAGHKIFKTKKCAPRRQAPPPHVRVTDLSAFFVLQLKTFSSSCLHRFFTLCYKYKTISAARQYKIIFCMLSE